MPFVWRRGWCWSSANASTVQPVWGAASPAPHSVTSHLPACRCAMGHRYSAAGQLRTLSNAFAQTFECLQSAS